ncbi:hypothetical protein GF337_14595 [candidate division KSB1 bacterium]|nr:hypothetical protein [candidate division KSB1 bacterium]
MCGLSAIFLSPQKRTMLQWDKLREIFTECLLANEEKGREACGIGIVYREGHQIIYKQPISASEFVKTSKYQEILSLLSQNTIALLGHTRKPTKGNRYNYSNNHPIHSGHIIGIHNGHIKNDDQLFSEYPIERSAEVDSEVIFQLIHQADPKMMDLHQYIGYLKANIRKLKGNYTFIYNDNRVPNRFVVIKKNRPLSYHWDKSYRSLFFSTSYVFLRKKFGRPVIAEKFPYNYGYIFDINLLSLPAPSVLQSFPV